ncbi:MAG: C39 family peptidase [Candidatus Colwellbacteria bacterium]|nr:C39 family peptidase [Candidatus Colwellbacteria bacterium]
MKRKIIFLFAFIILSTGGLYLFFNSVGSSGEEGRAAETPSGKVLAVTGNLPPAKTIGGLTHVWQSFNNCSSVALVIALSQWDIKDTQEKIALATRPWNNPRGDNDDKSVTLYELAEYAEERGLATYVRPNGDIELLKKFVANDIPVIARALTYPDKDYVHYRVVKGYDDNKKVIIESDGIEGLSEAYSYDKWMHLWKEFNYSYLVVVPPAKQSVVEEILGEDKDEKVAWQNAKERAEGELTKNSNDRRAHYNLVTALYYLGDYKGAVQEFEKVEPYLTPHKLWYQMEPIEAYFKLGNYDRVLILADSVINNNNKSVSELYILKGKIYQERGDRTLARKEFEKAVYYNEALKAAKDALASVGE